MTNQNDLRNLKAIAKHIARAKRIPHHASLDLLAAYLKQPHWNALTAAWNQGWRPDPAIIEALVEGEAIIDADMMAIPMIGIGQGVKEQGEIDGYPYSLDLDFEALMGGIGWCILVGHAPSQKPIMETYNEDKNNPLRNPAFVEKALVICHAAAERVRARIAIDWPRRSTKPDANGNAQHPLSKGISNEWFCLHCDARSTGAEMARNMWHCPKCSASPLDVHSNAWWEGSASLE